MSTIFIIINVKFSKVEMVSIGRGRGWAQNDRNSLSKPGKSLYSDDMTYINLVSLINLVNSENVAQKTEDVMKLINEKVDKENLKEIHDKLYSYALNNRDFGLKLLMVYNYPTIKNICDSEGTSLYKHLVKRFQTDYEKRKDLRQKNAIQFHNAVVLFSKYLSYIVHSSCKFLALQSALMDYMEMLLETVHGNNLHSSYKEKLEDLMITARQMLIKENLPFMSRQFLLYAIDLESKNFNPLPKYLQKFYKLQFTKNFKEEDNDIVNSLSHINVEDEHLSSTNEPNDQKYQSTCANSRGLRAIRGLGAADVQK
ncbi:hypothetical protein WN51_00234 [Melipona quadrifasciata]|uniref:Uncharacterized protein n=1 Tax=Melipona quadrifasciata TaxID=166423 RepID=A0A0N0BG65_9HYME|nr:hypothetical protein WN51_00234 [Melipona quadrifasciata]